ncbi:MAG: Atxe2 family lasso peptide isopeptidase [Candidatus Acidiferrum sp.]
MNYARNASVLSFLLASAALPAGAQEFNAVAFDPTPVRIPSIGKGEPRPVTSMDLLEIRDEKGVSISPDGKYVAFVAGQAVYETNSYRSGLYIVGTAPGSVPVCLGTAGAPRWDSINQWVPDPPQWSPDSKYITRLAEMDKAASWQVWRWSVEGGAPVQLTNVPGDVQSYHWTQQGDKIVMTFEKPRDTIQIQSLSEDGIVYDGSFDIAQGRPVVSEVLASKPKELETWIHDITTGEERKQTKAEADSVGPWVSDIGEEYFNGTAIAGHHLIDAKVSPDGNRVAYRIIDDSQGTKVLYKLLSKPVRGGTPVDVASGVYFAKDYWWAADSSKIYFTQNPGDGSFDKLMVVPAEGGTLKQVFSSPDSLYPCAPDKSFQYMACASENRTTPSQIALIDIAAGTVRTLVDLNPEFSNLEFGSITRLDGVNRFGDRWWAHLVKPVNYEPGKKYPLIVTTYRTHEFLRGASGDENPIQVYAADGFAVLSFDYGRMDYDNKPGEFQRYLLWYESVNESLEMAIQKASEMGVVDTTRVGLTGYSRGTEIVAYEITHTKLFRAVSGTAGDDSPYFYYMAPRRVQDSFSKEGVGGWPEGKSKGNWTRVAAYLNAERIDAPVLNNDPDSEFLPDLALYTSLRELGKPVELFIYPNELHHVNQPKHRYKIYERNLDWFRFWLKSEESPDPAKSEQYKRWRQLRQLQEKAQSNEMIAPKRQN